MRTARQLERGDVESVDFADPDPRPEAQRGFHRIPNPDERVAIRLHGHPFTYEVRVAKDKRAGPRMIELKMVADSAREPVDYSVVRSIPVRRLAYTAAQWIDKLAGLMPSWDDTTETRLRPESADPKVYLAAQVAKQALSSGMAVRPTVAAELNVSTRTVDRLLAKAKVEGWFEDHPLPKRPQPKQRGVGAEEADR